MFSIRLMKDTEERLENLALLQDVTKTSLVVKAIEKLLADSEEIMKEPADLNQKRYEDFKAKLDYEKEVTNPQIRKIFSWIDEGRPWTKKMGGDCEADGCPHGYNYVVGYTILNEGSADHTVAVVAKHLDTRNNTMGRYRYIIEYDKWCDKMQKIENRR